MSQQMKYIVVNGALTDEIYLFPGAVYHADFADKMGFSQDQILSAGFVSPELECYGKSISLGVSSRGEIDTKLIDKELNIY